MRQQQALAVALFLIVIAPMQGAARQTSSPEEQLNAAKILETTLFAKQATPDELKKLDRIYTELASAHPKNATIRNAHAEFLWAIGERQRATDQWQTAAALDPKNPVVLNHLGGSLLASGNPRVALEYFERASQAAPGNPLFHFNVANVCFMFRHQLGEPEEASFARALAHFAAASQLAPRNSDFARAYAETFYLLPKPDWNEALTAWQRFYEFAPQKDFALANLARVHMKLGEKDKARACLSQIQSPEYERLKRRLGERIDTE